jgi:hypothetical protein
MLGRTVLLFTLLLIATAIVSGAWFGRAAQAMPLPETLSIAQDVRIDKEISGDAATWLDKAIKRLGDEKSAWLHVKFRQRVTGPHSNFVAEGFLQTGPKHCVHRAMEVISRGGSRGRAITVSDGVVLAKVQSIPEAPDAVVVDALPASGAEAFLEQHGCGGPLALLRKMRGSIQNATVHAGHLEGRAVLCISSAMPSASSRASVLLDAESFMLVRYEETFEGASTLQIDFTSCEMGRELSAEECARLFSYQPASNEK